MEAAIFAYSERGCALAEKIRAGCLTQDNCRLYTLKRLEHKGFTALEDCGPLIYASEFENSRLLLFIGAAGIAVRSIAPYVADKRTDPAVICVDERGTFVIPLLSGHIGGANRIAGKIASFLGAFAAITTATDVNGRFSADEWAARHGFQLSDMKMAKYISAAILERDIPIISEFPAASEYPPGTFEMNASSDASGQDAGIYIGYRIFEPFRHTLRIIPPVIRIGIGCRRGVSAEKIDEAVNSILNTNGIDRRAVKGIYSIDLKADEKGIIEYCRQKGFEFAVYCADELKKVKGDFSSSAFVESVTGVDNVCERAAAAQGALIAEKTSLGGVTAALAVQDLAVSFDDALYGMSL